MDHSRWPHAPGQQQQQQQQHSASNAEQSGAPRPGGSFGPGTPQHQPQQSPPSGLSGGLPPPGSFPQFHQPHSLANLAGISQASPRQPPPPTHRPEDSRQPPQQGPGFALPSLGQATGQPTAAERERERAREVEQIHIKEEEDRRHREQERQRMEQAPPHQTQAHPVHLHQPVAVGPRTAIHGPNGLLGNPGLTGHQPHHPLGAPPGPGNVFAGGPVQPGHPHSTHQAAAGLLAPFGPGAQTQQPQQQMAQSQQSQGQGQGQQPILNDALSYLDQVKVQFADHPDVYNRFLDIMKDFKSGAIDTPGVIGRVSQLFAGNPELIQGFNTFLPPGYRIECGTGDDPNAIRVTTPMGTTVQAMPQPRPPSRQEPHDGGRPANGTYTPQPGGHSAQMAYSPSGRPLGPSAPAQQQHLSPLDAARQQQQEAMHVQEQRVVNSLQSAVSAAAGVAGLRAGISPRATPLPGQEAGAGDVGMEKRGPVEFNHAISYVNKIKNRFASHPDIYKQFLEILQTYQRESKPIQDVYGQVTHLFKTAPDLLEDFKQFLPESAAQAKAAERARLEAEIMTSNVRGEGFYNSPVVSREAGGIGTPAAVRTGGLPPVGNFAPTPASKDTNKRKRDARQGTAGVPDGVPGPSGAKAQFPGPPGKRIKQNHMQTVRQNEQPPTSPSLIPALPVPLEPTTTTAATSDELSFFDKAKKSISNKNVFNEFLKLCNLFSQDLIDRSTLQYRARAFIGGNPDLMKWFVEWLGYDERDITIENKPRVPSGRVMLSNCRGLGPSYRLLPKREQQKPCSGRDELCNSVLNDEWASHPTWASEDSGFVAHRKNTYEEGLHRIEEERHDYDFNIEAAARTVQLLEPIATQLRRMDDANQRNFQLPPGLGGQSETIYRRVIMKLYGREKGAEVIQTLHDRPYQVIPVLLNRIKERLESWKMAQREWEKVWREQTQKMFWRSLDHQAVQAKNIDRRAFQAKTLQGEIQVKYEEMKRIGNANPAVLRQPPLEFSVNDPDVLVDATVLVLTHVSTQLESDHPKLADFIRDFVPLFFGLDSTAFRKQVDARVAVALSADPGDEILSSGEDAASIGSRKGTTKNGGLLRAALDPGRGKKSRKDGDSNASASRASTPEVASNGDPEDMAIDTTEHLDSKGDVGAARWLDHPLSGNNLRGKDVNPLEPQPRNVYRMWANSTIYCFTRLFIMLYERLCKLKLAEDSVRAAVKTAKTVEPAVELGIVDKVPGDYFRDVSGSANYYAQMLEKMESVLVGDIEFTEVEDTLRRWYLGSGYPLYPLEKLVGTLAKDASQIVNSDSKDKSADMYALFKRDRVKDTSTAHQQTDYRKAADKMAKDTEMYRIDFDQPQGQVKMYVAKRDEPIVGDGLSVLDQENRWRYYIASYTGVDATEGINENKIQYPFLTGNLKSFGHAGVRAGAEPPSAEEVSQTVEANTARFTDVKNEEKLEVRVAVNNYRAFFHPETYESFYAQLQTREAAKTGLEASEDVAGSREDHLKDHCLMNNNGMKDLAKEDVEKKNESFTLLTESGATEPEQEKQQDVEMEQ